MLNTKKMTKEQYSSQLKTPMWQELRKKILKRDNYSCKKCNKSDCVLHVHHKYYVNNHKAWEYPMSALVTLCEECHTKEHLNKKTSDFIKPTLVKEIVYLPYIAPKRKQSVSLVKKKKKVNKKPKSTGNLELDRNKRIRKQKRK